MIRVNSEMQRTVEQLGPWFHNLHLPDGTETAPEHYLGDFPASLWATIAPHIPDDLTGWSVLDIGCNAGFYCFELARRGANVTGIDHDARYLKQARWAAKQFDLAERITFKERQVYDLAGDPTRYDLVLFMGVFYHLRYPLLGLDIVAERVGRLMLFQTMQMPGPRTERPLPENLPIDQRDQLLSPDWPRMAFIEHRLQDDPTNWWAANPAAVEAMLRSTGVDIVRHISQEVYLCEAPPEGIDARRSWSADNLPPLNPRA